MKKIITAVAAVCMCTISAMADLGGTGMKLTITHDQYTPFCSINDVDYTYGSPATYTAFGWGDVAVTSPAPPVGMDNALNLNFTDFSYVAFVAPFPAMGTIKVHDLAQAHVLSSIKILVNGINIATGVANDGNGFRASWSAPVAYNGNPFAPNVTVAWNSTPVPGPGSLALLGLAGLVGFRRRRTK